MNDLTGKVVVITGAASGIGRAMALRFVEAGARAHLVDINEENLDKVLSEVEERAANRRGGPGAPASRWIVDCTDAEAVAALADSIFNESEARVDVLVNNAGVCCGGPMEKLSLEDWRWTLDINLYGVIYGIHAFLPRMIEQGGGGHIVNTASMAGLVGLPMVAPYCASKAAVVKLSEALDAELAIHDIRVTAVCPGGTKTDVLRNARIELPDGMVETLIPGLDRWGADADAVARKVVAAVRRRRSFVATGLDMLPLWWLQRVSVRAYQFLARFLTKRALKRSSI